MKLSSKGKPITSSVPTIHYRANDDELEELYPSSSDEEQPRITESGKTRVPSSPSKDSENGQKTENEHSIDGNLSEGTPPTSDRWRMLSEIKGKITKTFEEKLSEMKNDRKKRRINRANSSISDSEDAGDVTPTDDSINEKQERECTIIHRKNNATRFVGFSYVKTGLKTKTSPDDSVESGVEAAEFSGDITEPISSQLKDDFYVENERNYIGRLHNLSDKSDGYVETKQEVNFRALLCHIKDQILQQLTTQLAPLLILVFTFNFFIPLPAHLVGFSIGVFITIAVHKLVQKIKIVLATTPYKNEHTVPVLEIPAAEEHAVQERYEGWLNELPYTYDPNNYHVARTKSVYFSLEGGILRIMETRMRIPKKAVWDEPNRKFRFTRRRVYNLAGAKIELLPDGLIRRR